MRQFRAVYFKVENDVAIANCKNPLTRFGSASVRKIAKMKARVVMYIILEIGVV